MDDTQSPSILAARAAKGSREERLRKIGKEDRK